MNASAPRSFPDSVPPRRPPSGQMLRVIARQYGLERLDETDEAGLAERVAEVEFPGRDVAYP